MMVVPQFPPPVLGGLEGQALELSHALVRLGVSVQVLSGRIQPRMARELPPDALPVTRVPFPRSRWLRVPVTGSALLFHLITKRRHYDVIHVHNLSWFGSLSALAAKLLRKPVLAKLPTERRRAFRNGSLRLRLFCRCDAIALLSPEAVDDFRGLGFPESRIFKTTNGVSTDRFYPSRRPCKQGPEKPLTVLFVGRLDPGKGLLDLVAVWPAVRSRTSTPVHLVICGAGPQEAELRKAIEVAEIASSVSLVGRVDDVAEQLRSADLFVLPSYAEGNSNAVLEAMACGLPIVSTTAGGTPLLVGPEGAKWLFEPGDRAALEDRLVRLLEDAASRQEAGGEMLRRARAELGIDSVAGRYRRVYELLAAGRRDSVGTCSSPVFGSPMREAVTQ